MTQEALASLRAGDTLAQTLPFEQLEAYHVPFDELTGDNSVEHQLQYWSTRGGKVALIGDSGAGKSSVMASTFGVFSSALPDHVVPTRIPVALAGEAVADIGAFGRHVVGHILNWAAPETLTDAEQVEIANKLADLEQRSGRRRRAGFSLGTGRWLPIDAGLGGDLTGAAADFERHLGNGDAVQALRRLVELFRARDLEPFLVFDDTDAWLQLPGQEEAARNLATGFFGSNVRMLTREIDCGFVLAVHRSYLALPAYQGVAELGIRVDEAFTGEAIQDLAAIYGDAPDLRRVMAIAGLAVRKAHDDEEATVVTREAVIAARSQRDTLRGVPG
jgi:energy-coupling factor transporter ATP-binding protein EcfA2